MKAPETVTGSVTVVIPSYMAASTLRSAILSVAQQTLLPAEVIVVDDASSDNSVAIVRTLQLLYPDGWLKIVELSNNVGAASARNVGWEAAIGSHIAFLDADDVWHPKKLELQWHQFQNQSELVLCGHSFRFPWDVDAVVDEGITAVSVTRKEVLWRNPFVTPSVMLRKDIPLRFCDGKRHMEDHLLWQEIVLSGYPACKLNVPLATINKPQFGASGLSSQLWAMQLGELDNYFQLRKRKFISTPTALIFSIFSLMKFVRRLVIVAVRKAKKYVG